MFFRKKLPTLPIEKRWEEIKKEEKKDYSPLSNIPSNMPALLRAYAVTKRAAGVGFDWKKIEDVYDKMFEEIEELKKAQTDRGCSVHQRRDRRSSLYHCQYFTIS